MNIFCSHKNHTITLRSQIVLLLQLPSPHCWANIDWARARKLIPRLHSSSNSTTRCHILRPSRFSLQTSSASPTDNVLSRLFCPGLLPRLCAAVVTLSTQLFSQAWCTVTLVLLGKIKKLSSSSGKLNQTLDEIFQPITAPVQTPPTHQINQGVT